MEREEFFRLKKIQEKNRKIKAEVEERNKKLKEEGLLDDTAPANMLDDADDSDILFK
jgi:hypothetical protein